MTTPNPLCTANEVRIPSGEAWLYGDLALPPSFMGVVLVAQRLQQAGLATLLFDLLTMKEERVDSRTREHRFDIGLLTRRMQEATEWVRSRADLKRAPIGYFGASTGSAAAIIAAARLGERITAVVSRGGRADLAGPAALAAVTAPTLLIVGGADTAVVELNQEAYKRLQCHKGLAIVPGATHLFEERGALEQVSEAAASWFTKHMATVDHES